MEMKLITENSSKFKGFVDQKTKIWFSTGFYLWGN